MPVPKPAAKDPRLVPVGRPKRATSGDGPENLQVRSQHESSPNIGQGRPSSRPLPQRQVSSRTGAIKIPVCEPTIGPSEAQYVLRAMADNHVSSASPPVAMFESAFAARMNTPYAVATSSGGAAIFMTLKALGIKAGDEIILPTFSMIACSAAVVHCGASPVFVDSAATSPNVDVSKIEESITHRTRGILAVHLYGQPCDMDSLVDIAHRRGLLLIEDAAQSVGATYRGRPVGTLGTAGCFSFYANKIITSGDGGMVVTADPALAEQLTRIRAYDFDDQHHYVHGPHPWNFKLSGLQAALGLAQLQRLNELIESRRRVARYYRAQLRAVSAIRLLPDVAGEVSWMFTMLARRRDQLEEFLGEFGVESRRFFVPLHRQQLHRQNGSFPNAERFSEMGINLPSASHMTEPQMDYVIKLVRRFYRE